MRLISSKYSMIHTVLMLIILSLRTTTWPVEQEFQMQPVTLELHKLCHITFYQKYRIERFLVFLI